MGRVLFWRTPQREPQIPDMNASRVHDLELEVLSRIGHALALLPSHQARERAIRYWAERIDQNEGLELYKFDEEGLPSHD